MFVLIFFTCLLLNSAQSENSISAKSDIHSKTTYPLSNSTSKGTEIDLPNKTKLTLVSEGGTIVPNTPDISLPKKKFTSLISLDEELGKTKEKAVVARKGVDNILADSKTDEKISNTTAIVTPEKINVATKSSAASKDIHQTTLNKTSGEHKNLNTSEVHKKPTILSYEALANMEKNIQSNQPKIPVAPSTNTIASSQIPSPNEGSIKKVYPSKATSSHPGMIMPVIITILVVPMFAIVGYMALRRGQEAWKNRHYKRMDFLLDGMYND